MSELTQPSAEPVARWWTSPYLLLGVLLAAIVLRLIGIGQWSLWQDEEMSIYFSQYQQHFFVRCFPPYFVMLDWLYDVTGISTAAGRAFSGLFGVVGIALLYGFCRKHVSPRVALLAAILLTVALGHLFWSQSIRYYTLLAVLQLVAVGLFYEGFEQNRLTKLLAAGVLFGLSLQIHFTGVLLLPVFVGYVMLVYCFRQQTPHFGWRQLLAILLPVIVSVVLFLPQFRVFQRSGSAGEIPVVQLPWPLLLRVAAYYGAPMLGLALLSPLFWRQVPRRALLLLLSLGLIPLLEMLVLGLGAMANVTWNHAFVAMYGCAGLAAVSLVGIHQAGYRKLALATGAASAVYYAGFLGLYYTTMHGDRERWHDACAYLRDEQQIEYGVSHAPPLYATVPEVVGYYLGVPADRAQPDGLLVEPLPEPPPAEPLATPSWFLVKASHVSPAYAAWFAAHCEEKAAFPAHTGPVDRTVHVYYCPAPSAANVSSPSGQSPPPSGPKSGGEG